MSFKGPQGLTFDCPTCAGHAEGIAVLRKRLVKEAVNDLWQRARAAKSRRGVPCPGCGHAMAEVGIQRDATEAVVDACDGCQIVWFDAREREGLPAKPPPVPPAKTSPAAAEAQVRFEAYQSDESLLDESEVTADPVATQVFGPRADPVDHDRTPWLTWVFGAAILVVFVLQLTSGPVEGYRWRRLRTLHWVREWGFVPADAWRAGGTTIFTSWFLHGSLWHAFTNAYFFALAGEEIERLFGRGKLLGLLAFGAVAGCLVRAIAYPVSLIPMIGASSGVAALFGWFVVTLPKARLGFLLHSWRRSNDQRAFRIQWTVPWVFGCWLILQLLFNSMNRVYISADYFPVWYGGHVGGALVGALGGLLFRRRVRQREA